MYCSGQIGLDPATGELVDGVVAQTNRALLNLEAVLKEAGLVMSDVVKTTVFLVDLGEYPKMNEEYSKHFSAPYPARSTLQASGLPRNARVEIDAIATGRSA